MCHRHSRRAFLATLGLGAAAFMAGCGTREALLDAPALDEPVEEPSQSTVAATPVVRPSPVPTPTPTPRPAGHEVRKLLDGTPWETAISIRSTGIAGPTLVVLGGVHGNEPGGWLAADQVASWEPSAGVLAVLPRSNVLAIRQFARLIEGEGDLNRQYPGDRESEVAMSRLAAEITEVTRELQPELLLDLHESWQYFVNREAAGFVNRSQAGTAFLGQVIMAGAGPRGHDIASELAALVNESITREIELFVPREGRAFAAGPSTMPGAPPGMGGRGRSSLSLGGHVPGLTPVLVETGQMNQSEGRRVELHLAVVRAAMDILGI